ncbi:MAG: alpha/beta hydrolase [Brevefilum sp.]
MEIGFWLVVVFFVFLLLYFGVGLGAAVTMTRVGDHPQFDHTPGTYGLEYETIQFPSRLDGFLLTGWYIPNRKARRAMILVHGRDASKQNAISGKLPELASDLYQAGMAVLMLDLRGHGGSEGKRYTWGVFERRDVLGAVDYLYAEGFLPGKIAVLGISLGGAAAVGAASEEPGIGALVLDSTFADLEALVKPNWRQESGLPLFLLPGVFVMWQAIYRFDLRKVKPAWELAEMSTRPVLVLHSRTDETVPVSHGVQLAEAATEGELVLFDGCEHAELFRDNHEKYLDTLVQFLRKNGW